MTSDRSRAYARVTRTLRDLGPAKLHDVEARRVRNAADSLLFADRHDESVLDALNDIEHLAQHLASTGRWTPDRTRRLADDVAECGPAWILDFPLAAAA